MDVGRIETRFHQLITCGLGTLERQGHVSRLTAYVVGVPDDGDTQILLSGNTSGVLVDSGNAGGRKLGAAEIERRLIQRNAMVVAIGCRAACDEKRDDERQDSKQRLAAHCEHPPPPY